VIPSRCEGTTAVALLEDSGDPAPETSAEHLWSVRTAAGMDHGSHEEILRLRVQDDRGKWLRMTVCLRGGSGRSVEKVAQDDRVGERLG
jgi:hypothetical protein